jgi:hypothetical protein
LYFGKQEDPVARGLLLGDQAEMNKICWDHKLDFKTVELGGSRKKIEGENHEYGLSR